MKYKILKAWTGVEVGEIKETDKNGDLTYFPNNFVDPLNIQMALSMGFIEEADKPWQPKEEEIYYFVNNVCNIIETINSTISDEERIKFKNCFRTKEAAEAMRDKILALLNENV